MNTYRAEFINKLAMETSLSYMERNYLLEGIEVLGNLEKAIEIYKNDGFDALILHVNQLSFGYIRF